LVHGAEPRHGLLVGLAHAQSEVLPTCLQLLRARHHVERRHEELDLLDALDIREVELAMGRLNRHHRRGAGRRKSAQRGIGRGKKTNWRLAAMRCLFYAIGRPLRIVYL
jgi:hypothetical protein